MTDAEIPPSWSMLSRSGSRSARAGSSSCDTGWTAARHARSTRWPTSSSCRASACASWSARRWRGGRMRRFDLIGVAAGPAGQRAAVQAAKLGKHVAIVERDGAIGGVSTRTGTVPSKTLRAAVARFAGNGLYRRQSEITIDDLLWRTGQVVAHEQEVIADQLRRNGVELLVGSAAFADPYTITVDGQRAHADRFVIAVGSTPARPADVDFDDRTVLDSDGILRLDRIPRSLTVVGAGVVGLEYASMAAALGSRVTVID